MLTLVISSFCPMLDKYIWVFEFVCGNQVSNKKHRLWIAIRGIWNVVLVSWGM